MIGKLAVVLLSAVAFIGNVEARHIRRTNDTAPLKTRLELSVVCGATGEITPAHQHLLNPADRCCLRRDNCPLQIPPKSVCPYTGVYNPTDVPIVNCQCEKEFHKCLKDSKTPRSENICKIYFSADKLLQCVNFDHRHHGCKTRYEGDSRRCVAYDYDMMQPMRWDLFDLLPCDADFPNLPDNSHVMTTNAPMVTSTQKATGYGHLPQDDDSIPEDQSEFVDAFLPPIMAKKRSKQRLSRQ